jgi:hypothetical protein
MENYRTHSDRIDTAEELVEKQSTGYKCEDVFAAQKTPANFTLEPLYPRHPPKLIIHYSLCFPSRNTRTI